MADIQLLINKINQSENQSSAIQQNDSPVNTLINKINSKQKNSNIINNEIIKSNNYNDNKGSIIVNKTEGFDGFTDIPEIKDNAELYSTKGNFIDGLKGAGNDYLYGYLNSVSSFYHTLGNIPGGLNKLNKYAREKFGLPLQDVYEEDSEKGLTYGLQVAEDYLKSLSIQYNPHEDNPYFNTSATFNYRPTAPDDFVGKINSAIGAAPVTIGEYIPATRLLKSMPLGFATTDALRESDKGFEAAAVAGAKGYVLGTAMKALEPFNIKTRVASMGALGYGMTDGNVEDKLVGGITFATLSAIGRLDGKNLKEAKSDLNSYLSGRNYQQNKFIRELELENNKQVNVIESKSKELSELNEEILLAKDAYNKGDKSLGKKELNAMEKRYNRLESDIYTLRDNYNHTNAHVKMSKEYLDLRSTSSVINSLIKPKKVTINKKTKKKEFEYEPTEKDVSEGGIGRIIDEFIFNTAPARFVSKAFPNQLFKKGVDLVTESRIATENSIDSILRNPVFNKVDPYFLNIIKGLTPKSGKEISLLPANQYAKTGRDPNSVEAILENNASYLNSVIEKLPAIEKFATQNKKNKQAFKKSEGDVTINALKKEFKFNDNQILVYKTLRRGLKESLKFYNEMGAKYGGKSFTPVNELPSYFPHIWLSDFRIFVRKKSNNELITVLPANNKVSSTLIKSAILRKNKDVKVSVDKAQRTGDLQVNVFAETMNFLRNNKKLAKEMQDLWETSFIQKGFNIHKMPRKQKFVDGYLGANTNIYKILGMPESIASLKRTSDFVRGYTAYVQGAIRSGHQIKLRRNLKQLTMDKNLNKHYKNTIDFLNRYYSSIFNGDFTPLSRTSKEGLGFFGKKFDEGLEYALSNFAGANGLTRFVSGVNSFTLTTRLLVFNMRFALSQVIQPYQMIIPQLSRLRAIGEGGSATEAFLKSQKDLIKPSKEAQEVIKEAVKNRNISAAFLNEFTSAIRGKSYKNFDKFITAITGKGFSARLEQFSRMNATLMFYHSLRGGGMSHKMAKNRAWQLSDTYMVEYNSTQRPMLYGSSGFLGSQIGKSFGLFKTFQHNYLAQMVEHIATTKKTGDIMPTASFAASMVFTAGLYGVIGIEVADTLLAGLDKVVGGLVRKTPYKSFRIPTFSEWLYENNFHPFLLFGVPSTVIDKDLTSTLAAPAAIGLDTIFTLPPGVQLVNNVAKATKNYLNKKLSDNATEADTFLFYKSFAPNLLIPVLEASLNAKLQGQEEGFMNIVGTIKYVANSDTGENRVVVIGAGNKVRAKVKRDLDGWFARLLSTYTLEEAYVNKMVWHVSKMESKKQLKEDDWTTFATISILKGGPLDDTYIDYMVGQGYNADRIIQKIINKSKDLTQDVIQKNLKGDITVDKEKKADIMFNDAFDLVK